MNVLEQTAIAPFLFSSELDLFTVMQNTLSKVEERVPYIPCPKGIQVTRIHYPHTLGNASGIRVQQKYFDKTLCYFYFARD